LIIPNKQNKKNHTEHKGSRTKENNKKIEE